MTDAGDNQEVVLNLEGTDWHEYLEKGYENLGTGRFDYAYQYLERAIELMDESEFAANRSDLIEKISDSLINTTVKDESEYGDSYGLMFEAFVKENVEEESFFGIAIVDRIKDAVKSMDPDDVPWVYMEYCELLKSIIAVVIDPRVMLYAACCAHLFFDVGFKANYKIVSNDLNSDVIEANNYFYSRLIEKLQKKIEETPEEELVKIIEFWAKSGNPTYIMHLYNASACSMEMFEKGMFAKHKLKKEANQEVDAFVNTLFGCVIEEVPE